MYGGSCQSTWRFWLLPQVWRWSWREPEDQGKPALVNQNGFKFVNQNWFEFVNQNRLIISTNRETTWETWQKSNSAGELLPDFQRLPSRKCLDRWPMKRFDKSFWWIEHFADDVWALQRLLWTSWLCRRSIRHYFWLSFHQSFFYLVHKSSPVWENGGKVTDPVRLHKQGRYLQSGVRTKGVVLLVRLVEKKCLKLQLQKKA